MRSEPEGTANELRPSIEPFLSKKLKRKVIRKKSAVANQIFAEKRLSSL
jgi:hypothetical protein